MGPSVFNAPRGIWISLLSFRRKIWASVAAPPVLLSSACPAMRKKLALSFCRSFASGPTVSRIDENPSNVFLCSPVFSGGKLLVLCAENAHAFLRKLCRIKWPPLNVIVMREQLNVKQRQDISETPAKGGGGGLVESCFSLLGRIVAFPGKLPCPRLLPSGQCTHDPHRERLPPITCDMGYFNNYPKISRN